MFVLLSNARPLRLSQPSIGQVAVNVLLGSVDDSNRVRLFRVAEDSAVLVVCKELRLGFSEMVATTFLLGSGCDIDTVRVGIGGHKIVNPNC